MESLYFIAADGSGSVDLTDYTTYFLQSRKGFSAPPVQHFSERFPGAAGARAVGTITRERTISFALAIKAAGHEDALLKERTAILVLRQNGYLYSWANSRARRLDVEYRGGLEGDTAGRLGGPGGIPILVPEYVALQPYWTDPNPTTRSLDLAVSGSPTFPVTFPIYFSGGGGSGSIVLTAGEAASPWLVRIPGPLTLARVVRVSDGAKIEVAQSVGFGQQLLIDTAIGQRRVLLDTNAGVQNATHALSADSVFWDLLPGANNVGVYLEGSSGSTVVTFEHPIYYVSPG